MYILAEKFDCFFFLKFKVASWICFIKLIYAVIFLVQSVIKIQLKKYYYFCYTKNPKA